MKKIRFHITIIILVIITIQCKKPLDDYNDYLFDVETVSATVLDDGSVEVNGRITSDHETTVNYWGFCCDTLPEPKMLNSQLLAADEFTAIYTDFDPSKKYYFRAWAANDYGYVYGNIISIDSIFAVPVVAPCNPTMNTVNTGGSNPTEMYYRVNSPESTGLQWRIVAEAYPTILYLYFKNKPTTKIYTTTTNDPEQNQVRVSFTKSQIGGTLESGSQVYVNKITETSWQIGICDAPWLYNGSSTFYITTKFECPL